MNINTKEAMDTGSGYAFSSKLWGQQGGMEAQGITDVTARDWGLILYTDISSAHFQRRMGIGLYKLHQNFIKKLSDIWNCNYSSGDSLQCCE
jgi:hypothetical protein